MRSHHTQVADDFNAAQLGQADVKRDHIRLQRRSLMDGVNAICSFADDHHLRQSLEQGTERAAERLVVLDDEHSTKGHQIQCITDGRACRGNLSSIKHPMSGNHVEGGPRLQNQGRQKLTRWCSKRTPTASK